MMKYNVKSPKQKHSDENTVPFPSAADNADGRAPTSVLSEEKVVRNSGQLEEEIQVTERNTFLEVDDNRGSKTLSIFRCYTSPVYRRLFSGASSSGVNESTVDLTSWADNTDQQSMERMVMQRSTSNLDTVDEHKEIATERPENRLSVENIEKLNSLGTSTPDKKTHQNKEDKRRSRQFTADLEPFGKFEQFDIEPLNSGGRRSSMHRPAPLDDILLLPATDSLKKRDSNTLEVRRGSKDTDQFHSANASPAVGAHHEPINVNNMEPLALPQRGDSTSSQTKKVLVHEDHGGVPESHCTTIMVRNIPNKYSQRMLLEVFTEHGFDGVFDFLYVPADFFHRLNLGYCFVNFKHPVYAQHFARIFQDFHLPAFKSKKKIQISLANTQGFITNVMKLEHTALCSQYVSPEFHPICIDPNTGQERPFLSFFPGYKAPPPNRIQDPDYWAKRDEEHAKQWEGDSLYPPVFVSENSGCTSKNNRWSVNSPAVTPPSAGGIPSSNRTSFNNKTDRRSFENKNPNYAQKAQRSSKNTSFNRAVY